MLSIEFFYLILTQLKRLLRRYRTRKQLYNLGEHELRDIGISRFEALQEASKPFWKS